MCFKHFYKILVCLFAQINLLKVVWSGCPRRLLHRLILSVPMCSPICSEPDGLVNIACNVKRVKISLTAKRCVRLGTYEPNLYFCLWRKATVNKICNSKSARRLKWDTAEISLNGSEGCELKNQSHLITFGVFVPVC